MKMERVADKIYSHYRRMQTPSQFTRIDFGDFCDPSGPGNDFPNLGGKAGQIRHLVPILHIIWNEAARPNVSYDMHIGRMLEALKDFYEGILSKDVDGDYYFVYPQAITDKIRNCIDLVLLHYAYLCRTAADMVPPRMLWNMVSKFHHTWHAGEQAEWTSLRAMWCYNNEDFMGLVQGLGEANRHGLIAAKRSIGIGQNYVIGRSLEMYFKGLGPLPR